MKFVLLAFVACALGCVVNANKPATTPLVRRASFDMQCAQQDLQLTPLDDRSYGVSGCHRRATYIETCQPHGCTWVLNGSIESTEPVADKPAPTAPTAPTAEQH